MGADPRVLVFPSPEEVAERAAGALGEACAAAPRRAIAIALPGGSTPVLLFERLARSPRGVPWERVEVFFGDERAVPPDHRDSNYRQALETLLSRVPLPPGNVHRMPADEEDLDGAARRHEAEVRRMVPPGPGGVPAFDLVWLGVGEDGHTASLFPGAPGLPPGRLVAAVAAPALPGRRMTFTLLLLNAARRVQLLVTGKRKAEVVRRILDRGESLPPGALPPGALPPAGMVRPEAGVLEWLLDREAAGGLGAR